MLMVIVLTMYGADHPDDPFPLTNVSLLSVSTRQKMGTSGDLSADSIAAIEFQAREIHNGNVRGSKRLGDYWRANE